MHGKGGELMYTHLNRRAQVLCNLCMHAIEFDLTHEQYYAKYRNRKDLCADCQKREDAHERAKENA